MANAPKSLTIRSYNVGFGDCYLLSFTYGPKSERHVLIDFGSTALPKGAPKTRMMDIALDIERRTGKKLHAVVATHRHKDHISGFETKTGGKGTGDVIKRLKPSRIVQPWTEDPELEKTATGPTLKQFGDGTRAHIAALNSMNTFAEWMSETRLPRYFSKEMRDQLSFLGEENLKNKSAINNLMKMAPNSYVHCGSKSGLETLLPGVKIDVMGPPTVKQTASIKKQRSKDPDEFWHLAARFANMASDETDATPPALFNKRYIRSNGSTFPVDSRWLIYRARTQRGDQLLQIVRMLDKAMNNTSVILLFRVGKKSILFPGDAQIENWQFALAQAKYKKLLASVDLYKVGHHGSLNATPKSLWKMFKKRNTKKAGTSRLRSLMSTLEGKHGSENSNTEVPRRPLVSALRRETEHFSTHELDSKDLFRDVTLRF